MGNIGIEAELNRLREENQQLRTVVAEAARCFYGPDEQKPNTWGWEVAHQLFQTAKAFPAAPTHKRGPWAKSDRDEDPMMHPDVLRMGSSHNANYEQQDWKD